MKRSLEERLWAKVHPEPNTGCWFWLGATSMGYGKIGTSGRGKSARTHRVAYELYVGPIPEGLEIDHLCRNRGCCNPDHLETVTRRVNMQRSPFRYVGIRKANLIGASIKRTAIACKRGHLFDDANTYRYRGIRHCRLCSNKSKRTRRDNDHLDSIQEEK